MKIILSENFRGKLTHVTSAKDVRGILKTGFKVNRGTGRPDKPEGIWLSVDDGWEKWKEDESFKSSDDGIVKAEILPNLKLLVIDTLEDFMSWMKEFDNEVGIIGTGDAMNNDWKRMVMETSQKIEDPDFNTFGKFYIGFTSYNPKLWEWTASKVDGIYLTDKGQWATRLTTFMYGWDCATVLMFDEKNVKFSNPRFFLTQEQECHICKGKGYMDFGKMHEHMEKDLGRKLPSLMKHMPCYHCNSEGKLMVSSRMKKRDW